MVEMSILALLLATILMGLIELGLAWHSSTTLQQASRLGVRAGAGLPLDERADREALRALVSSFTPSEYDEIDYVVIYDATVDPTVPDACKAASDVDLGCNRYDRAALALLDNDARWGCTASAFDRSWCPRDRDSTPINPTYIGLYVAGEHPWISGFFPGTGLAIEGSTVMSIVPADY